MMSSTKRGKLRHRNDNYVTPAWCVRRLLDYDPSFLIGRRYLEPCVGDGAIIRAFQAHPNGGKKQRWDVCEVRRTKAIQKALGDVPRVDPYYGDFFKLVHPDPTMRSDYYDLTLTNPPFSLAWLFLQAVWPLSRHVCFLLRLNFFGSAVRHGWMQQNMPDVYILPDRPKFARNKAGKWGTDSIEYAWFHWDTSHGIRRKGETVLLDLTPLEERNEGRGN